MRKKLLVWLGWLISFIFIYFVFRRLDWMTAIEAFHKVSFSTITMMVGAYCFGFIVRAWRWKLLLPRRVSIGDSLGAVVLGYGANNILPARLGEIVRAQAIGQKCQISRSFALASVLVERIFDGLVLVTLLYLGIRGSSISSWISVVGILGICIFGGALILVTLLALTNFQWNVKTHILPSIKLQNFLQQFVKGLTIVWRTPFLPLTVLGLSFTIWLIEAIVFHLAMQAFEVKVPFTSALFVMGAINLGILIPTAPGYLGAFQYFGTLALSTWQVPKETALACIVFIHACQYLPITIWASSYISYFGFTSLTKLRSEVE